MEERKTGRKKAEAGEDAPSTRARRTLATALVREIATWNIKQGAAAARLGLHRSALNRLIAGDIARFSLGYLLDIAANAGLEVTISVGGPVTIYMQPEPPFDRRALFGIPASARGPASLRRAYRVDLVEHADPVR